MNDSALGRATYRGWSARLIDALNLVGASLAGWNLALDRVADGGGGLVGAKGEHSASSILFSCHVFIFTNQSGRRPRHVGKTLSKSQPAGTACMKKFFLMAEVRLVSREYFMRLRLEGLEGCGKVSSG